MKNHAGYELSIKSEYFKRYNRKGIKSYPERDYSSNCIATCEAGTGSEWISIGGPVKGSVVVVGK